MQQCKCRCGKSSMNFKFLAPGQLGDGWEGECCQEVLAKEEAQPAQESPKAEAKQEEKPQESKRSKKRNKKNKAEVKESAPEAQPEQEQQNEEQEDRGNAGE